MKYQRLAQATIVFVLLAAVSIFLVMGFAAPMSLDQAENIAKRVFNHEVGRRGYSPVGFVGPILINQNGWSYYFDWELKPNNAGYSPVRLFVSVGGFAGDEMRVPIETIEYFRMECEKASKAGVDVSSLPFSGECI